MVTGWGTRTLLEQAGKHRSALGELRKPRLWWRDWEALAPAGVPSRQLLHTAAVPWGSAVQLT